MLRSHPPPGQVVPIRDSANAAGSPYKLLGVSGFGEPPDTAGEESIQTTGDIYTDWDIEQLADTVLEALDE